MKTNVEKVLERDQKLSELDDRADALQQGASQFEQQAGKLKRKFWLQNLKMMIIMGVIGLIIVAYIGCKRYINSLIYKITNTIILVLAKFMGEEKPQYPYPPPQYAMPPPQQQQVQAAAPAAGGVKPFFPISNSERYFRV
jgi:vesicle-associated membrane protein 2